jgi:hypothetical protein
LRQSLARGGITPIAVVARRKEAPHRTHDDVPGMFSNWQLGHCMGVVG